MSPSCPICLAQSIESPRALVCGHTFCEGCIAQWHRVQQARGVESCPLCRTSTAPPSAPSAHMSMPSLPAEDRATALARSAQSRARRLATDYPRVGIRAQLEAEHARRGEALARRRELELRISSYQSALVSPISGRPLSELEHVSIHDFDKVFGRGATLRSAYSMSGSHSSFLHSS
mmetsp:Transcript_6406/g.17379  ORF Transcript_6406/g.17379 Transcript_6406/m.17379 type:complete len:176 (-) Transcript_6406:543-1070(-)